MHAPLRALLCALLLLACAASAPTPALAYDDAGYLAYADRLQQRLDTTWNESAGQYRPGSGGVDSLVNALMLLTHSVAAQHGHSGPARNDHRARLIARALVSPPVFIERPARTPAPGSQTHAPGWTSSMYSSEAGQHLVYDATIVDGLVHAWKARRALDLPDETTRLIVDRIHRVASSRFWRWPTIRLNQINWYALMYAADATVTGHSSLLRRDLHGQLMHFVASARRSTTGGVGNFGPGLRFHYLPDGSINGRANVDSAEYANIVLSFLRFYDQARHAGMAPLSRVGRGLIRRWERRAIAGYWTHAGYLNWDSGLGFERWHQAKKIGLAQEALLGIAQVRRLRPSRAWGSWAKWMFDRGLRFYEGLPPGEGGLPDPVLFKLYTVPQGIGSSRLAAARLQANAARAVEAGLGHMPGASPPALYAFDPDIGRLAVTTPAYNTAIVAVNQRAFPYGGIELARLFDGEQRVAANVGGRAPAAFGLLVRQPDGRRVFSSQTARAYVDRSVTPLRLTRAPSGTGATARTAPGRAFAGPFHDLRARGSLTAGRFRAVTSHRFTPSTIETRWLLERRYGRARLRADVLLPSWGRAARVVAVLRDGSRVSLRARAVRLARVRRFEIASADSGYTVVPLRRPSGCRRARARARSPVVEPRPRADARDRARARRDVEARPLRRPDRLRALAARRLSQDQLAAPQRGRDLAGLLDLSVRVADRVVDRLDVDPWHAHEALIPANDHSISPANTLATECRCPRSSPPGCSRAASCSSRAAAPASGAPRRRSCGPAGPRS